MRLLEPGAMLRQRHRRHRTAEFREHGRAPALQHPRKAEADPVLGHHAIATGLRRSADLPPRLRVSCGYRTTALRQFLLESDDQFLHCAGERRNALRRFADDREVGAKIAHRRARRQRVLAHLDDRATVRWPVRIGRPRRQRVDDQDRVSRLDQRGRVVLRGHRMIGRKCQLKGPVLADRNTPILGQFAQRPKRFRTARAMLREDHGIYMAGSGRINVAGLHRGNIDNFIAALEKVAG